MDPNILSALQAFGGIDHSTLYALNTLHAQGQLSPNTLRQVLMARGFLDPNALGAQGAGQGGGQPGFSFGAGMSFPQSMIDALRALGSPGQF